MELGYIGGMACGLSSHPLAEVRWNSHAESARPGLKSAGSSRAAAIAAARLDRFRLALLAHAFNRVEYLSQRQVGLFCQYGADGEDR